MGITVLIASGSAWFAGVKFSTTPSDVTTGISWTWAFLAVASCFGSARMAKRHNTAWRVALLGVGISTWFYLAGEIARQWWWSTWLPLGLATLCFRQARAARRQDAVWPLLTGVLVGSAPLFQPTAFPELVLDAVMISATLVLTVWVVGLQALYSEAKK
jgi:hypothetical protein